jgi:hypothetical protein
MSRSPRSCGPCSVSPSDSRADCPGFSRLPANRRGALLLIALVMLALFLMLGTTFIIIASRQKACTASTGVIGSESVAAGEETSDKVNGDILVGAPDLGPGEESPRGTCGKYVRARVSKYLTNSLLADKYGDWYEQGAVQSVRPNVAVGSESIALPSTFFCIASTGQLSLGPTSTVSEWFKTATGSAWKEANQADNTRTPLGPRVGRILAINSVEEPNAVFRIVAETNAGFIGHLVNPSADFNPANIRDNATFTIQGREFTGDPGDPFMLHETYDAPDNRNLFLSWVQADAVFGRDHTPRTSDDPSDGWKYVVPSFHRPDKLLAELKKNSSTDFNALLTGSTAASALSLLRPMGKFSWSPDVNWLAFGLTGPPAAFTGTLEHPNFTGSNTRTVDGQTVFFDPINGPWDVDNDNDGVRDSVWIDVGMDPVQIDGVECQPLVAMMIVDLDSRVNLNAHGSLAESIHGSSPVEVSGTAGSGFEYAGTIPSGTSTVAPAGASLPAGMGWGVADINPGYLFGATDLDRVSVTLKGSVMTFKSPPGNNVSIPAIKAEGRYGDSANGAGLLAPAPGRLGVADSAIDSADGTPPRDAHVPNLYGSPNTDNLISSLGSPIDPRGITKIGLDRFGQPLMSRFTSLTGTSPWEGDRIDDPYDISLGRLAPRTGWDFDPYVSDNPSTIQDNLFAPSQLERLLRIFESDSEDNSPRLLSLLGPAAETARMTVTTESWDSTAVCVPLDRLRPLLELTDQNDKTKPSLISWDLQMGLRMDVNRPFGDGIDNSQPATPGFAVSDEPGEFTAEVSANAFGLNGTTFAQQALTNGRDADGDGVVDAVDQSLARQLFARHLYVLARTLVPTLAPKEAAQWAVNVVDFRDPDSIITRFQFDPASPASKGWNPQSADDVVWGCERPELLITEALAWRNIEEKKTPEQTFQYRDIGTGGLVIELYHPWTGRCIETKPGDAAANISPLLANALPAENNPAGRARFLASAIGKIDLSAITANGDPVFQIVVIEDSGSLEKLAANPSWPRHSYETEKSKMKRVVYPAKISRQKLSDRNLNGEDVAFSICPPQALPDLGPGAADIRPGQFAIVAGPVINGTGDKYEHVIAGANDNAGMEFNFQDFAGDLGPEIWRLRLNPPLFEDAFSNDPAKRVSGGDPSYPDDFGAGKGPIGALVCVQEPDSTDNNLRLPTHNGGQFVNDLNFVENGRYRILLRRLANPLADHDSDENPYICIDSLAFHDQGIIKKPDGDGGNKTITLHSAERCRLKPDLEQSLATNREKPNNIWRHSVDNEDPAAVNPNEENQTRYRGLWKYCGQRAPGNDATKAIKATLGFLPSSLVVPAVGDGFTPPFPWLTWLNREFASVHELLLVPKSSPATLLREHSHAWPFEHLFFRLGSGTGAQLVAEQNKAGILEFLRVPSRFADAEQRVNPADAVSLSNALTFAGGKPLFLPPHNYLSHFREPGRINLNTLSSEKVWSAMNGGRPPAPYEDEVHYSPSGTPVADFEMSEDWKLEPAANKDSDPTTKAQSHATSGNWKLDGGEDSNTNSTLDLNHDLNNDGSRQVSGTSALRSIATSRRGWPISPIASATGATAMIAGNFDRVLNRKNINEEQLWFSKPFQSGWPALTTSGSAPPHDDKTSLMFRSWWNNARGIRLKKDGGGYGRTKTLDPISLAKDSVYIFTIRLKGDLSLTLPGADKFPEIVGANDNVEPYNVTRSSADGGTTYTCLLKPTEGRSDYRVQLALWSQESVDILSVSLKAQGSDIELIANNDFAAGLSNWEQTGQVSLLSELSAENTEAPMLLLATNLNLQTSGTSGTNQTITRSRANHSYADPDRNPYFRYREIIRLSNLATARSNCFAVWMTIGFFKIEKNEVLESTALGAEYGLDSGDVVRHKAFFIIDRSIPVGYRPGVRLNSDDATLHRRFINN